MKHYVNLLKSERGVTLVELLVAVTIFFFTIGVVYGVFQLGIKTYKKVGVESQLRDEADIVLTEVMNAFYQASADDIQPCGDSNSCITIYDNENVSVSFNEEFESEVSIIDRHAPKSSENTEKTTIEFIDSNIYINERRINSSSIDLTNSTITSRCKNATTIEGDQITTRCVSAMVTIYLEVKSSNYQANSIYDPILKLSSKFGF